MGMFSNFEKNPIGTLHKLYKLANAINIQIEKRRRKHTQKYTNKKREEKNPNFD